MSASVFHQFAACLDIDAFDDPTHGAQQLTFFHGYYSQYQYQPVVITCAENDQTVLPVLLYGTAHAATATLEDVRRVERLDGAGAQPDGLHPARVGRRDGVRP